jgi:ATP-dependent Lhr-like helicase
VEEWFIARLEPGDCFWFAGRNLELVRVNQNTVFVKKTQKSASMIPSWLGGRMSMSSHLSSGLRDNIRLAGKGKLLDEEMKTLEPIFEIQKRWSLLPDESEFLIETSKSREGYHTFFYPFEGRNVHEGLSALIATRLSQKQPITFTIAMNDYGFELLSDQQVEWNEELIRELFLDRQLERDLMKSVNTAELAKRRFRGISRIAGLVFQGFPGRTKSDRHLQISSSLFYDVFSDNEPNHPLLKQSYDEVLEQQLEETRIRIALQRIANQQIIIRHTKKFSPFAFPIFVDRLRERVSSEKLADRIRRMQTQLASEFNSNL